MCVHLNKENSQRTLTLTTRTKKTHYKNKQAQLRLNPQRPRVLVSFQMLQVIQHVVGLLVLCAEFTCCQCTKLIHFLTCTRIPCRDSRCENGLVRCCLYTPRRLQQTAVSCKRSICNKKSLKVARLRFSPKTANNGSTRCIMSLCT